MARRLADRFVWAIETLDVAPSDRLLEIGCGPGLAVGLICDSLTTGRLTGIDGSPAMIAQAVRRNREHVERGTAVFLPLALEDAGSLGDRLDKVFAINVRLCRSSAAHDADVLRRLLKPRGRLYFFQQHPSAQRTRAVTSELQAALELHGFEARELETRGTGDSLMTSIVA